MTLGCCIAAILMTNVCTVQTASLIVPWKNCGLVVACENGQERSFDDLLVAALNDFPECLERFVDYRRNGSLGKFVPNAKFWARSFDFSCASPWNSGAGPCRAGTAISRRHIVYANHFPLWRGLRLWFVGADGESCVCSLAATKRISGTDIVIGLLDAELTPNIRPAKVLPSDCLNHLPKGSRHPLVTLDQGEKAVVTDLVSFYAEDSQKTFLFNHYSISKIRPRFKEDFVVGDSGNPAFVILAGEPVLVYCLSGGGIGAGPWLYEQNAKIQQVMDELCPGYRLEFFDFKHLGEKTGGQ